MQALRGGLLSAGPKIWYRLTSLGIQAAGRAGCIKDTMVSDQGHCPLVSIPDIDTRGMTYWIRDHVALYR